MISTMLGFLQWKRNPGGPAKEGSVDGKVQNTPTIAFVVIALCLLCLRVTSNLANYYLDFTTKVLFQSSKMVPLVVFGVLFLKKKYSFLEYVCILLICAGLYLFSSADASSSAEFHILGVVYMILFLASSTAKDLLNEHMLLQYKTSVSEMVFKTNLIGLLLIIPSLIYNGEFVPAITDLYNYPVTLALLILLHVLEYSGSVSQTMLIKVSDALAASIVASSRRVFSIVLSFLLFSKVATTNHVVAGLLYFAGMTFYFVLKNYSQKGTGEHIHVD